MTIRTRLKDKVRHRCTEGHPWIYDNEIARVEGNPAPGEIVVVQDPKGRFVGQGYWNAASTIRIRLLTRNANAVVDRAFLESRLREAWKHRELFVDDPRFCRVVFSEGDRLPGLIVDRFGDVLSVQVLTLGMDCRREMIFDILNEMFRPKAIVERSDVSVRRLEGLEMRKGVVRGELPGELIVNENEFRFHVDALEGQKTGFFFDQRENRRLLKPIAPGADVLDTFAYVGSFGIHAAGWGARHVETVDSSEAAIAQAQANARLNGVAERMTFTAANAFDLLKERSAGRPAHDIVILDPPAFAKNRAAVEGAMRGYKEINLRGMKLTKPGGWLVTCSCSHHVNRSEFVAMVLDAANDAGREIRLVESRTQARDHPVLPAMPESEYLKTLLVQVL